ncbi:MFS transporter [Georgenia subflava]|uniref:MFS transporter n=1 Tax=Georgenia subflava TaxID=1622177 RepID=A0A6N7ELB6_9MICO|nr:MFS transporter [Georgenia subflava]MPV37345.1 MFS transporter [Georgenia subflava]
MTVSDRNARPLSAALLLAGILLVAINLRPVITSVGPILPQIGADTGLGSAELGVLAAVPVIAFAVVSPLVHPLARRFGMERTVLVALLVLGLGTLLRSLPGPTANLWLGTVLIGATVGVGNVALPAIVKKDFPFRVSATTGWYVATQSVFAAIASGLAVPLAGVGTWRLSLGLWAVLIVVGVLVWLPRITHARRTGDQAERTPDLARTIPATRPAGIAGRSVYRTRLAWLVAAYMGLQSLVFYTLLNWLPSVEQDLGVDAATAGWHLFTFQAVAIGSNLAVPSLMHLFGDQRFAASFVPTLMVVAMLGLWLAPGLLLVWVVMIGLSTGAAFVVALSLVGLRSADATTASQLSSMSQAVGYGVAALGLVGAGVLRDLTGPGPMLLVCLAVVALAQLVVGLMVGRERVLQA